MKPIKPLNLAKRSCGIEMGRQEFSIRENHGIVNTKIKHAFGSYVGGFTFWGLIICIHLFVSMFLCFIRYDYVALSTFKGIRCYTYFSIEIMSDSILMKYIECW